MDKPSNESISQQGVVMRKQRGFYLVRRMDGTLITCSASNRLRKKLIYPIADPSSLSHRVQSVEDIDQVDPLAIGDRVEFILAGDETGMIESVLPRWNSLSRQAAGREKLEQVMAANIDQIITVFAAAQPAPKWSLLDRYLVTAEQSEIPAVICITKMDLADLSELNEALEIYRRIGYRVVLTSSATGEGMDEIKGLLAGKASVLMGKSGVGKTSLLNAIQPGLGLKVGEVGRGGGKGKHTTTHLEMFPLDAGGGIIDTPGMREFSLWEDADRSLALFFPEMKPYVGTCRFGLNCSHQEEPGCAIREAVMAGKVHPQRYLSLTKLAQER